MITYLTSSLVVVKPVVNACFIVFFIDSLRTSLTSSPLENDILLPFRVEITAL
jgi:hypothetical protein